MKSLRLLLFAVLLFPVLILSCVWEGEQMGISSPEEETEVKFSVILPFTGQVTRALSDLDESEIKTVEVLVFDVGTGEYKYTAYTDNIENIDENICTFTLKMLTGTYNFIVLVNSRHWISHSFTEAIQPGTPQEEIEQTLIAELAGKWETETSSPDYYAIPMWGEKKSETITEDSSFSVTLTRMLSRIDVSILEDAQENFELKAVRLYNYNTAGRVIPDKSSDYWDGTKAIAPSIPDGNYKSAEYLEYSNLTEAGKSLIGEIYTFEAEAGSRADFIENTCLLIYGEFEGVNYYYRADFQEKSSGSTTYLPLKRNHRYQVKVKDVTGPGFEDPDEALKSLPVNFEVEIVEWHNPNMDDMEIDGEYYYKLSPLEKIYWTEASSGNEIKILTNYPTWSYVVTDSPTSRGNPVPWVTTSGFAQNTEHNSSLSGDIMTYNIPEYTSGNGRTAYFHVTAGRFSSVAKIIQYPWKIEKIYVSQIGPIPPEGETRDIVIEGYFDDTPIRATDLNTGQEIVSGQIPAGNISGSAPLEIPAWMSGERTVAFEYFDARNNLWRIIRTEDQLTDPTKTIDISIPGFSSGQGISSFGETFQLEISGMWPAMEIRAINTSSNHVATPVQVNAGTGSDDTYTITIEPYESWGQRYIYFQWSIDGNVWYTITTGIQTGYHINNIMIDHNESGEIHREGETFSVAVEGFYPDLQFRASIDNVPVSSIETINAGTSGSTTIDVPANMTENPRWITMEYSSDGGITWIYISSGNQPSIYIILSYSGRTVALDNAKLNGNTGAETMTWAEAMGIETSYNSHYYYRTYNVNGSTNINPGNHNYPGGSHPTGCHAYSEPGYGPGTWRCPNVTEMWEMIDIYKIEGWTSAEEMNDDPASAQYGMDKIEKNHLQKVRCVRD